MTYRVVEGSSFNAQTDFIDDESGEPVIARSGYPKVWLKDGQNTLFTTTASPGTQPGSWNVLIPVAEIGLDDSVDYRLIWVVRDMEDNKYRLEEVVTVTPKRDLRLSEVVYCDGDPTIEIVVPANVSGLDTLRGRVFLGNKVALDIPDLQPSVAVRGQTKTAVSYGVDAGAIKPTLEAMLLRVDHRSGSGRLDSYTYKMWCITPQLILALSHLESFLNKSRIENVIPELEYTPGDLVGYLERGLYMFNTIGFSTDFSGTNMQGVLFNAHVLCSQYYALSAQLIAEGSLAFNFSGQGVTLDVDRTPQLEGALGRVEQMIQEQVVPLKKQLARQNIRTGDGSIGSTTLRNSKSVGTLGLSNSPVTRFPYYAGAFIGRRS